MTLVIIYVARIKTHTMDDYDLDELQEQGYRKELFQKALAKCNENTIKYIKRSKRYRFLNITLNMMLIVGETTLGLFLAIEQQDYVSSGISFAVALIHAIMMSFKINSLGIEFRLAGTRTSAMARRLTRSIYSNSNIDDVDQLVGSILEELEDISLHLFSRTYGPTDQSSKTELVGLEDMV